MSWDEYPDEIVDRKWRTDAARLHRVLDTLGVTRTTDPAAPTVDGPTLARILDHLSTPRREAQTEATAKAEAEARAQTHDDSDNGDNSHDSDVSDDPPPNNPRSAALAAGITAELAREGATDTPAERTTPATALWDDAALPSFRSNPRAPHVSCWPTTSPRWSAARPWTPQAPRPVSTGSTARP